MNIKRTVKWAAVVALTAIPLTACQPCSMTGCVANPIVVQTPVPRQPVSRSSVIPPGDRTANPIVTAPPVPREPVTTVQGDTQSAVGNPSRFETPVPRAPQP